MPIGVLSSYHLGYANVNTKPNEEIQEKRLQQIIAE